MHFFDAPRMTRWLCKLWLALACAMPWLALAQSQPSAGSLLQQSEQALPRPQPKLPPRPRVAPPEPMAEPGAVTVLVQSFQLDGNTLIDTPTLQAALGPWLNRALSFAQLKQAAEVVVSTYRSAGWWVQAYLPKQDVTEGRVTIHVVEAAMGQAMLTGKASQRMVAERLVRTIQSIHPSGEPLSIAKLDRALLVLDDLPGVSVVGSLMPGRAHGETDVGLVVTDEALWAGSLTADNFGGLATGTQRLSANLALNSPLRQGDLLSVNALKTQGSHYVRLAYSLPWGYEGWRVGFHTSDLNYSVIGVNAYMGLQGSAFNFGLDASYPLWRSQMRNLNLQFSVDHKRFDNTALSLPTTRYAIAVLSAGLAATEFDDWQGGGASALSLSSTWGQLRPDDADPAPSQNSALQSGAFRKINLNLSRQQALMGDYSAYAAWGWQGASRELDASEKLYLGGVNGVRAYPANEISGSRGHTLLLELRQRWQDRWTFAAFHDYGWVKRNVAMGDTSARDHAMLRGLGVSVAWQGQQGLDVKTTLARRIGENPLPLSSGFDSDGTLKTWRLWLNATVSF